MKGHTVTSMDVDATDYEHLGDPDGEHSLDRQHHRLQEGPARIAEAAGRVAAEAPLLGGEHRDRFRALLQMGNHEMTVC